MEEKGTFSQHVWRNPVFLGIRRRKMYSGRKAVGNAPVFGYARRVSVMNPMKNPFCHVIESFSTSSALPNKRRAASWGTSCGRFFPEHGKAISTLPCSPHGAAVIRRIFKFGKKADRGAASKRGTIVTKPFARRRNVCPTILHSGSKFSISI